MALFARVAALFRRAPLSRPRIKNINPHPQEENMEMVNMEWFASCGSYALHGDDWQYVSREEIAAANRESTTIMHTNLDAKITAARNVQRQNQMSFAFDIGECEVDGFMVLDTPHQTALNFGKLLDKFNSNSNADEESFTF